MINIYIFNLDNHKKRMIDFICSQTKLTCKEISQDIFGLTLYQILNDDSTKLEAHFDEEMLIFNCNQQQLDVILQMMKAIGLYIPYKAMITPTNLSWTPAQLIYELKAEHAAIRSKK